MTQAPDPVVAARQRARAAGEDDVAYDRAMNDLETASPTTLKGARIQLLQLRRHIRNIAAGDTSSDDWWEHLQAMGAGIDKTLKRLDARALA